MKLSLEFKWESSLSISGDITGEADTPIFCNDAASSKGECEAVHSDITVSINSIFCILYSVE